MWQVWHMLGMITDIPIHGYKGMQCPGNHGPVSSCRRQVGMVGVGWRHHPFRLLFAREGTHMDPRITIRAAVAADAAAVAELHVRGWQWAYRDLLPAEYLD